MSTIQGILSHLVISFLDAPVVVTVLLVAIAAAVYYSCVSRQQPRPRGPANEKSSMESKSSGQSIPLKWTPSDFKTPVPPTCPDFDLEKTAAVAYRPFRYGPKFFMTMGLRTEPWERWYELDKEYPKYHADKARRIRERGDLCSRASPEGYPAAVELLEELVPHRHRRDERAGRGQLWQVHQGEEGGVDVRAGWEAGAAGDGGGD